MKKMMKLILVSLLVLGMSTIIFANSPSIVISNKKLPISATSKEGRMLVPLRAIFEALGARVDYDSATKTITGIKGDKTIVLKVNNKLATVNGKQVILDVPATVIHSVTLVPVRFIGESLGADVKWESNTVLINSDAYVPEVSDGWIYYNVTTAKMGQSDRDTLYKTRPDGSGKEKVFEKEGELMFSEVVGEQIIYASGLQWNMLYKDPIHKKGTMWENNFINAIYSVNKNGTGEKYLVMGDVYGIHDLKTGIYADFDQNYGLWYEILKIKDGWIYFQIGGGVDETDWSFEPYNFSKIRLDGTGLTKISNKGATGEFAKKSGDGNRVTKDGYLYYVEEIGERWSPYNLKSDLYKQNLQSGQKTLLASHQGFISDLVIK